VAPTKWSGRGHEIGFIDCRLPNLRLDIFFAERVSENHLEMDFSSPMRLDRIKTMRFGKNRTTKEHIMKLPLYGFLLASVLVTVSGAQAADGQAVYNQDCGVCHNAIPPKVGDNAAWAPRIKQGTDALVANVIKGKGMMPARAGHADLSDDDIKAAVGYIESKAQ